jgi:hypothetical protein
MSRRPVMSALARTRARNRALRAEMVRVAEYVERKTREAIAEGLFDPIPTQTAPEASTGRVLEGHIEGDRVIVDAIACAIEEELEG